MNGDKLLNGLDLDYHFRVDDKIWPKPQVNYFAIVFNGYWLLLLNTHSCLSKLMREKILVNRLEQTRAKNPVDRNCLTDDLPGEEIFGFVGSSHGRNLLPPEVRTRITMQVVKSKKRLGFSAFSAASEVNPLQTPKTQNR